MIYFLDECPIAAARKVPDKLLTRAADDAAFALLYSQLPDTPTSYEVDAEALTWIRESQLHWQWTRRYATELVSEVSRRFGLVSPAKNAIETASMPMHIKSKRFRIPVAEIPVELEPTGIRLLAPCEQHRLAAEHAAGGWRAKATLRKKEAA